MSITIGFLNKNEKPAEMQTLQLLKQAYNSVPYDSYTYKVEDNFALGHMNIDVLTENPIEPQPVISESGRYIGSGRIRIDNREDLISSLEHKNKSDLTKLSDTRLFLIAFEKWNTDSFDKIIGDYAFVIWDRNDKKMFIAKDMGGHYPLYYYETKDIFYFASTITAFFELPEFYKEINYKKLVEHMVPFPAASHPEDTLYMGIKNFKKFHYYVINSNGIVDTKRHWFPENLTPIKYKTTDEYINHFKELYEKAVISRISKKGQMGSYLSGGLDSSSVSVISHDYLRSIGKQIYSYSSVPKYIDKMPQGLKSISDETPFIQTIVDMYPDIIHKYVMSEDFSPLDAMDIDLKYNKIYTSNFQNGYWHWKILQLAQADGVNVMMTGQAGNLTISRTGADLIEQLFRLGRFGDMFNELSAEAKMKNRNLLITCAANVYTISKKYLTNMFPEKLDDTLQRDNMNPFSKELLGRYHIMSDYIKDQKLEKQEKYNNGIMNSLVNKRILQMHLNTNVGNQNIDYHLQHKIEMRDATGDKRINEFTKQIPAYVFKNNGLERYLIREAMKGKLPDKVRLNLVRGKQAKDLSYRVKLDMARIEDNILNFNHSIINFDKSKINQTIQQIKDENYTQELFAKTTKLVLHPVALIKFIKINE